MVKYCPMTGLTHVSSGKYFLYWASLMAGATVLASSDWASTMSPLTMQRLSNDRLDRALNWTLWSTGAVMGSVAYLSIAKTSLMHHYIDFIHVEHLCATIISSAFYIYVIKNGLPHLTKNVPPLQNRLLYGAIGTAVTGAITSAALNIFTKSYTPWGKQGLAIQAIFSLACGMIYSQLGVKGIQESVPEARREDRFERKLHPMIEFEGIMDEGRKTLLQGYLVIQTLSQLLAYEEGHHKLKVNDPLPNPNGPMDKMGVDVIRRISLFLSLADILNLAQTSRRYYRCIGLNGAPIWNQRKLECFREFCCGEVNTKLPDLEHTYASNNIFALMIAWPDRLLHNLGALQSMKEGVAILLSGTSPLEKLTALIKNPTIANCVLMARLVSNKPELFKEKAFWETCSLTDTKTLWYILAMFSLPGEALEPFCAGIKENKADNNEVLKLSWGVIQRAKQDFPNFIPEKNLLAPLYPDF